MKSEAEILFQEEITAKKREGFSQRARTGSKGGSGSRKGLRTPYDNMTTKERKKLSSAVVVKNLFDLLLSKEEFNQYPEEKQREILIHWRDIYPNAKIMEALEIKSQGTFASFLAKLDVPKKRSWKKGKDPKPQKEKKEKVGVNLNQSELILDLPVAPEIETNNIIMDGLQLNYNGLYNADQIARILTKLQLIVDGEENLFSMSISLQEKK